jgi:hypothetical protein
MSAYNGSVNITGTIDALDLATITLLAAETLECTPSCKLSAAGAIVSSLDFGAGSTGVTVGPVTIDADGAVTGVTSLTLAGAATSIGAMTVDVGGVAKVNSLALSAKSGTVSIGPIVASDTGDITGVTSLEFGGDGSSVRVGAVSVSASGAVSGVSSLELSGPLGALAATAAGAVSGLTSFALDASIGAVTTDALGAIAGVTSLAMTATATVPAKVGVISVSSTGAVTGVTSLAFKSNAGAPMSIGPVAVTVAGDVTGVSELHVSKMIGSIAVTAAGDITGVTSLPLSSQLGNIVVTSTGVASGVTSTSAGTAKLGLVTLSSAGVLTGVGSINSAPLTVPGTLTLSNLKPSLDVISVSNGASSAKLVSAFPTQVTLPLTGTISANLVLAATTAAQTPLFTADPGFRYLITGLNCYNNSLTTAVLPRLYVQVSAVQYLLTNTGSLAPQASVTLDTDYILESGEQLILEGVGLGIVGSYIRFSDTSPLRNAAMKDLSSASHTIVGMEQLHVYDAPARAIIVSGYSVQTYGGGVMHVTQTNTSNSPSCQMSLTSGSTTVMLTGASTLTPLSAASSSGTISVPASFTMLSAGDFISVTRTGAWVGPSHWWAPIYLLPETTFT